jgi:Protein of unknown function (DUF2948)
MSGKPGLKLRIEDAEDLAAVSLHVQDAILRVADIHRLAQHGRVAFVLNRFRWERAGGRFGLAPPERIHAGLHFDFVTAMRARGVPKEGKSEFLELLALTFEPASPPAGIIGLTFAGGGTLALEVDCIDGALVDIGEPWRTPNRPHHEE